MLGILFIVAHESYIIPMHTKHRKSSIGPSKCFDLNFLALFNLFFFIRFHSSGLLICCTCLPSDSCSCSYFNCFLVFTAVPLLAYGVFVLYGFFHCVNMPLNTSFLISRSLRFHSL